MKKSSVTKARQLLREAKQGDPGAREELFKQYYPRLRRHTRCRVGRGLRRDLDSQDIVIADDSKALKFEDLGITPSGMEHISIRFLHQYRMGGHFLETSS